MRHKVVCSACGCDAALDLGERGEIPGGWIYFGAFNVKGGKTDKYFFRVPFRDGKPDWDAKHKRVPNKHYDPKARPRYVEMWECPKCYGKSGDGEYVSR